MHTHSPSLVFTHLSPAVLCSAFSVPHPSLAPSTGSHTHKNTLSPRSNAAHQYLWPKTLADHLCLCMRTAPLGAYIRERIKHEREIMKCFLTSTGQIRREQTSQALFWRGLYWTNFYKESSWSLSELGARIGTLIGSKATLLNTAFPLAWGDMTLWWSEWGDLSQQMIRMESREDAMSKLNIQMLKL